MEEASAKVLEKEILESRTRGGEIAAGAEVNKVVAIAGHTSPVEPVADVVAEIETLLARAKSGELRGIAYVTVAEQTTGTGWTGGSGTRDKLSSGILMLFSRYGEAIRE